jgi:hypothetical protein
VASAKANTLVAALVAAALVGQAAAQPPAVNPAVRTAIAKPMDALDAALAKEAAAPPPASDREKLESMGRIDQSWRYFMGELKLDGLTPDEQKAAYTAIAERTEPIDNEQVATVMGLRPMEGWFPISTYGRDAALAAFNIVQHGSLAAQKSVLPAMTQLAGRGEVDTVQYAAMYDRVQVRQGKPQRYGTQFKCVDNRPVLEPLEDPARVEALRATMKIPITLADLVKGLAQRDARC